MVSSPVLIFFEVVLGELGTEDESELEGTLVPEVGQFTA
jgi:hypothetical protein